MTEITRQETEALVQTWKDRAEALSYKQGSKECAKLETECFVGAFAMLAALGRSYPSFWNIIIMSGRSLSQTLCSDKEPTHE